VRQSHSSHQLRVTGTGGPNHNVPTATPCSEPSHILVETLLSSSRNSPHWTERDFVRQITTDNRQLRPALRRMNSLSSACQHSSESYERMEMLILSRNLRCGSALVADRKNTTNTYIEPRARHPEVLRHTSFRPVNTNRWIDVGDKAAAFQRNYSKVHKQFCFCSCT
jgi:hypothetical protein